jgi:hypothetical protein
MGQNKIAFKLAIRRPQDERNVEFGWTPLFKWTRQKICFLQLRIGFTARLL